MMSSLSSSPSSERSMEVDALTSQCSKDKEEGNVSSQSMSLWLASGVIAS